MGGHELMLRLVREVLRRQGAVTFASQSELGLVLRRGGWLDTSVYWFVRWGSIFEGSIRIYVEITSGATFESTRCCEVHRVCHTDR